MVLATSGMSSWMSSVSRYDSGVSSGMSSVSRYDSGVSSGIITVVLAASMMYVWAVLTILTLLFQPLTLSVQSVVDAISC